MEIIPVIDLMHGQVVHAHLGQRQHYQPIQSLLCRSSAPIDIANALLGLYPFRHLYIADIDAITGQGNHLEVIQVLQKQHPTIEIWLDAGISHADDLRAWQSTSVTHVIGSENIASLCDLKAISQKLRRNFVLSLDFNQTGFLGAADLQSAIDDWPEQVIVMALHRVGSQSGIATELLQGIINTAQGRAIYAAGGVKSDDDIKMLSDLNVAGALVATALHNGSLGQAGST